MRIPGTHLDRLVSSQLLDHLQVLAAHCEPRAKGVPIVVPAVMLNLRLAQSGQKPHSWTFNGEHQGIFCPVLLPCSFSWRIARVTDSFIGMVRGEPFLVRSRLISRRTKSTCLQVSVYCSETRIPVPRDMRSS